ncbi:unnamed protein product [Lactuca virosa]|uniref:U1-type domain-containing protein n=1 Tax=Lactuca virosa TaxID=75947 RepID=A0AAU9MXE8_9ASTR|nr:unnamed protein product [Lactuca virosa]
MEGPVDIRETIQRELEKEMIRVKIIAEEVERFHVLEAEVRRELMIGREMMAMKRRSGYPSSFMLRSQPGEVKEITTSLPKVAKPTLYGAEQKPPPATPPPPPPSPPPPPAGSTELTEKKMEWRCEICNVRATCERGLLEHFAGKKHKVKVATLSVQNSVKTQDLVIKKSSKWRCAICDVSTTCERGLHDHLAGKKHRAKAVVEGLKANKTFKIQVLVIKNSPECVPKEDNKKSPPPSREISKKKMEWKQVFKMV